MTEYSRPETTAPTDLMAIIAEVRSRWRMKLVLRGAVRFSGVALALLLLAAFGMEWARFSGPSIIASRVLMGLALIGAAWVFLLQPFRRRVTDEQVALYLEEHEPSLQASLLSAVEASRATPLDGLLDQPLHEARGAVERCTAIGPRSVERDSLRRNATALAGVAVVAALVVGLGPAFLRSAVSALLLVSRSVEAAAPYRIEVTPGDATVPKGADQTVAATLHGFEAPSVSLMVKRTPEGEFEELPLIPSEGGGFDGMLFDVATPIEYFVEASGVRSRVFTLRVVDLPYVDRLELEYRFPAFTGLDPQIVEDGGDIAVLQGTEVHLRIYPTMQSPGGRLTVNDVATELTAEADGSLAAVFTVDRDGYYRIELDAPTGERVAASPQYTIDALDDMPPSVSFSTPGRDTSASSIEEVLLEVTAQDDFGVRNLELVYSVNGGEEKSVSLFGGRTRLQDVTAGHTLYLEEMGLEPGDTVSYYARAADNGTAGGGQRSMSDLYFVRVRPFN
ncbi:MAG: hypothetical protein HOP14_01670, partial [Acidobacteria bacterium]|nr:hypothetical protein [Acidobacteriota bacterium]